MVPVTLGATDPEADPLNFAVGSGPSNGVLDVSSGSMTCSSGSCTADVHYAPNPDFNGSDSFTFTADDGTGGVSNVATVTIDVTAVNDVPSFTKGANQVVNEDSGAKTVLGWATALDTGPANESGQVLNFNITGYTNSGLFSVVPAVASNGTLTFTPAADANGLATITLDVQDNGGITNGGVDTSATQTFTIMITAVNDAPVCAAASKSGAEDTVLSGRIVCTDVDLDSLTYSQGAVSPTHGRLTLNSDGTWSYTPNTNYNGSDSFSYRANDGIVNSTNRTVTLTVTAVNDPPAFTKGANQVVNEDSGARTVVGWATGAIVGPANETGQSLTGFTITGDTNATLFSVAPAVASNGTLTFTPGANRNGLATVTVRLTDSGGTANGGVNFSEQTFTITVDPVNDPPNAANDVGLSVHQNAGPTPLAVLANDSDLPDTGETLKIVTHSAAGHGTVTITGGGTGLTYTPAPTYLGSDAFTYTISDGALTDAATVLLDVVKAGTVTRLAGADRFATSAAVSRAYYPAGTAVAFIANGLGFADALAGAPLAGKLGGPILLIPGTSIPASVATELSRLKPGRIVILGGPSAVSAAVAIQLGFYTAGP